MRRLRHLRANHRIERRRSGCGLCRADRKLPDGGDQRKKRLKNDPRGTPGYLISQDDADTLPPPGSAKLQLGIFIDKQNDSVSTLSDKNSNLSMLDPKLKYELPSWSLAFLIFLLRQPQLMRSNHHQKRQSGALAKLLKSRAGARRSRPSLLIFFLASGHSA